VCKPFQKERKLLWGGQRGFQQGGGFFVGKKRVLRGVRVSKKIRAKHPDLQREFAAGRSFRETLGNCTWKETGMSRVYKRKRDRRGGGGRKFPSFGGKGGIQLEGKPRQGGRGARTSSLNSHWPLGSRGKVPYILGGEKIRGRQVLFRRRAEVETVSKSAGRKIDDSRVGLKILTWDGGGTLRLWEIGRGLRKGGERAYRKKGPGLLSEEKEVANFT